MRFGRPDMIDSPWRNGMSGVAWRIARDSTGRDRVNSRRGSESRDRDENDDPLPSGGSDSSAESEERRPGRSRSTGREDWRDEWQSRRRDAYSPSLGRQMARESARVHRAAASARFSLWGIMMIMVVWMAFLQHTFRFATITLLHAYSSVLPMEFRALDWATRGRSLRKRGRGGFEGRRASPAWQAIEAGADRGGDWELVGIPRPEPLEPSERETEGEWEQGSPVHIGMLAARAGGSGSSVAVPMMVRVVRGEHGEEGGEEGPEPLLVIKSPPDGRRRAVRPFGWLGDGWEEGAGDGGDEQEGRSEGEREVKAVEARQARLVAELNRMLLRAPPSARLLPRPLASVAPTDRHEVEDGAVDSRASWGGGDAGS